MSIAQMFTCSIALFTATTAWALPNPATQFCAEVGGQACVIVASAGEAAMCDLDSGSVEAWTLFRYIHGTASIAIESYLTHPAQSDTGAQNLAAAYCVQLAGASEYPVNRQGEVVALCRFADNSTIAQATLLAGPEGAGHARLNAVLSHRAP